MAPTEENGVISPLFTLEEDPELVTQSEPARVIPAPITTCFFDLDDTLYPHSAGLSCVKNIEDYMVQHLGFSADTSGEEAIRLYKEHGTSMAGLRAEGYAFDFDDWHAFVHGRLPYHLLKPDPALRHLLESLPQRKFVFTNADRAHASRCLHLLGLEGCFDAVIAFEDVMAHHPSLPFSLRNNFRPSCTTSDIPNVSDGSEYLLDSDHGLLPSSLPPIPSASSTASLPSANLSSDCSNGSSGSSSPERLLPISIQEQQEGPSEQQQQQQQQQQRDLEQQESKQVNLPQVPPFRCNSRRCVSADALVEHAAAAHPLAAHAHRDVARLAAASPAAEAAAPPPAPTATAAAAVASKVAQSWSSPARPLICCKPQAEAFHRAVVGIARADPHSSIFFDDSTRNIAAAKRFGMLTVLVGTSQSSAGADYVMEDIHEMKKQIPALWTESEHNETGLVTEGVRESPCICHQSRNVGLVLA
ncbi:unnamed protein product [Closterium sp. NIES-53]